MIDRRTTKYFLFILAFAIAVNIQVSGAQSNLKACKGDFIRPAYKSRGFYCSPGQVIKDAYDPKRKLLCEEMEVDHLISLRHAWDSGVCGEDLKRLANDPRNLRFTYWKTNRSKGYLSPENFAKTRSRDVSKSIVRDANTLRTDYRIATRDKVVRARILSYALSGNNYKTIPLSSISSSVLKRITYKKINGKNVAFLAGRAIGYSVVVGLGIEAINASGWAVDWLMSPSRDERMNERAITLKAILRGENEN